MDDLNRKKINRVIYLLAAAFFCAAIVFALNGTHFSNVLKKALLPEMEMATGRKVFARKISVNIFPLFAEATDVKIFNEAGEKIVMVKSAKAYVDLCGFLSRQIVLRRIVIKDPEISLQRKETEELIGNIKKYLSRSKEGALKVKVLAIEVRKGTAAFKDASNKTAVEVKGLNGEAVLGDVPIIRASAPDIHFKKEGWPDLAGDVSVGLTVEAGKIFVRKLAFGSLGSKISGSGDYDEQGGKLSVAVKTLFSTLKTMFGLERSGEGHASAEGIVNILNGRVSMDMKLQGSFFIQTLMELLKVKEKIEGFVEVKGEIKGPLNDLKGSGKMSLKNGNLFDVDVDSLDCKVSYANGTMNFTDGSGRLFNGNARVAASIRLPVVNFYTVNVDFKDIDSTAAFRLINWDPGIGAGKVTGTLATSGASFNPRGRFEYRSYKDGKDILGRINHIVGAYVMQGPVLAFDELRLNSSSSEISARGTADIERKQLNMEIYMNNKDVLDLTTPYYDKFRGSGEFSGKVTGAFNDPVVSGKMKVSHPFYEGYKADLVTGDFIYRKELLEVTDISAERGGSSLKMTGSIFFKKAQTLFDLRHPEYRLKASFNNADLERFAKIFYPDFSGEGRLRAEVKIRGTLENPQVSGDGTVEEGVIYDIPFDRADFGWSFAGKKLIFENMKIIRGKSVVSADAELDSSGRFVYKASSESVLLSDLLRKQLNGDVVFSAKSEGAGTFDNPSVSLDARIIEGKIKGKRVGSGVIKASVRNKDISFGADLFEGKVRIHGKGRLERDDPWSAEVEIQSGRYDTLISSFLKDVPEDLLLTLNGKVLLHGDRKHFFASSTINQITLSMYGYSFTNEKAIKFDVNDKQIVFDRILLRSGNTSVRIDGGLEIGKQYNISLEGSSSLGPLKSLSSRIAVLRGDTEFVLSVIGPWEKPEINGGVTITNGSFGLKDYPYRFNALSGYLYMDNDRIVVQKLSGKIGGGDIDLSGFVYLKKFAVRNFYIEAGLDNVTSSFSGDFNINLGGNVLLRGTPDSQMLSGDIRIIRARYKERIEWKSWLLKAKKTEKIKGELSGFEKAELNIKITGKENIHIDNNVARGDASVDMILKGTVYRPVLLGRLEMKNGTLYFRNSEFRVVHASADFTDPKRMNPFVNISADTVVKGYKIKMNMEGQLDRFNMALSSDPFLKEMDILSLLTVGQTSGELKGLEGGIGASEATSFVTGKLQDVIEERFKTITGLDRFQIDPHVSKVTGTVEPRVTVSKRLLGDRVFVTYASTVGSTEEQIIRLEYALSKSMSLVGMRDERGIVGGDIRFRFEFK